MNSQIRSQRVTKILSTQKSPLQRSGDSDYFNLPALEGDFSASFESLQSNADQSSQAKQLHAYQRMADTSSRVNAVVQCKGGSSNKSGLPDHLKEGVEQLSGISMDDVRVHYNSSQPQQLNAHAYAQGSDIHLGPGQEKHLAHEAWHVVQQEQGRVKPTMQMKGNVQVNDDGGLEREADVMGEKALNEKPFLKETKQNSTINQSLFSEVSPIQRMVIRGVAKTWNKFDENHLLDSMSRDEAVKRWDKRGKDRSTVVTKDGFKNAVLNQADELLEDSKTGDATELSLNPGEGMMVTTNPNATKKQQRYLVDTADSIKINASVDKNDSRFAFIYHLDETEYSLGAKNEEGFPALPGSK